MIFSIKMIIYQVFFTVVQFRFLPFIFSFLISGKSFFPCGLGQKVIYEGWNIVVYIQRGGEQGSEPVTLFHEVPQYTAILICLHYVSKSYLLIFSYQIHVYYFVRVFYQLHDQVLFLIID